MILDLVYLHEFNNDFLPHMLDNKRGVSLIEFKLLIAFVDIGLISTNLIQNVFLQRHDLNYILKVLRKRNRKTILNYFFIFNFEEYVLNKEKLFLNLFQK